MSSRRRPQPVACILAAVAALTPLAAVACSRTPPEPAPPTLTATSVPSAKVTSVGGASGASAVAETPPPSSRPDASRADRCISPTPSAAPPPPRPAPADACPPDVEGPQSLPSATVAFPDAEGRPRVEVELAKVPHDIERGLMYRRSMSEQHGMLFRLGERREHTFWMHNTCIPLDMLFVDDDGVIVGIVEGAEPLTDTTRTVGCPSSWVLELNAGWCRRHGVRAGQRLGIPPAAR